MGVGRQQQQQQLYYWNTSSSIIVLYFHYYELITFPQEREKGTSTLLDNIMWIFPIIIIWAHLEFLHTIRALSSIHNSNE